MSLKEARDASDLRLFLYLQFVFVPLSLSASLLGMVVEELNTGETKTLGVHRHSPPIIAIFSCFLAVVSMGNSSIEFILDCIYRADFIAWTGLPESLGSAIKEQRYKYWHPYAG